MIVYLLLELVCRYEKPVDEALLVGGADQMIAALNVVALATDYVWLVRKDHVLIVPRGEG